MADYANALVRFKAKSKYCDAIEQVFNKALLYLSVDTNFFLKS